VFASRPASTALLTSSPRFNAPRLETARKIQTSVATRPQNTFAKFPDLRGLKPVKEVKPIHTLWRAEGASFRRSGCGNSEPLFE